MWHRIAATPYLMALHYHRIYMSQVSLALLSWLGKAEQDMQEAGEFPFDNSH